MRLVPMRHEDAESSTYELLPNLLSSQMISVLSLQNMALIANTSIHGRTGYRWTPSEEASSNPASIMRAL
jgi:hypothetical protein